MQYSINFKKEKKTFSAGSRSRPIGLFALFPISRLAILLSVSEPCLCGAGML